MIKIIVSKIYINHKDLLSLNTNKPNYLLKTHFFKNSFMKNSYHDVYFNQIIDKLKKKYNLVIYGHVHENYYYIINKINKNNLKNFYSIEYFLSFKDVILCFFKILFYKIEFKNYYFFDIPVNSILKNEFRFSNVSLYHLLIYYSLKNLTKKIKFQKSLMTYENISWENMFISSLKKFNQNVEILGYQHTVVPESACGMYTPLNEINIRPLPNRILTVGKETKKIIEKYSKFDPNNIIPTCALRFLHLFNHQRKRKKKIKNILIALEGVKGVENLVNYIFKNSNSHYNYLISTHVELPWNYIKKNIKYNINNFKNIRLSKNINIYDDLLESDCCIYWGSTVSIEALALGIPIINYNNNSYLKYDPLFLFNDFKWETSDDRNLNNLLIEIDQLDHEKFIKKQDSAIKYLNNYFYDISDYNINYFL